MSDSKSVTPLPRKNDRPLLVIRAKAVRVVVASLITLGVLGIALILVLQDPPSPRGVPHYREAAAVVIVILMPVSLVIYCWARYAIRLTLTAERLYSRIPVWWLVRTITIPLPNIQYAHAEKRFISTGRGGGYYRDFLVIAYDTEKTILLQINAYHSRDLWNLLTNLKQQAPQIKFDADIRRFLYE